MTDAPGKCRQLTGDRIEHRIELVLYPDDTISRNRTGVTGWASVTQHKHFAGYLKAINKHLGRLQVNPAKGRPLVLQIEPHWKTCKQHLNTVLQRGLISNALQHYRGLFERFHVSLLAQR